METGVDAASLRALCDVAGITVADEDRDLLTAILGNQLAAARSLLLVGTSEEEPIVTFDPRWR